jgi:hypothetical protein
MTRDKVIAVVKSHTMSEYDEQRILTVVDEYSNALLRQTPVSGSLELLQQLLIKKQQLGADQTIHFKERWKHSADVAKIQYVLSLISEPEANDR